MPPPALACPSKYLLKMKFRGPHYNDPSGSHENTFAAMISEDKRPSAPSGIASVCCKSLGIEIAFITNATL